MYSISPLQAETVVPHYFGVFAGMDCAMPVKILFVGGDGDGHNPSPLCATTMVTESSPTRDKTPPLESVANKALHPMGVCCYPSIWPLAEVKPQILGWGSKDVSVKMPV